MRRGATLVLGLLAAGVAFAEAPTTSIRPQTRPVPVLATPAPLAEATAASPVLPAVQTSTVLSVPHPRLRPEGLVPAPRSAEQALPMSVLTAARLPTLRPKPRPANLLSLAANAPTTQAPASQAPPAKSTKKQPRKGSVCGDPDIRGTALAAITSKTKGCGVPEPVKITMIDDVALNPAATISCDTAAALKKWIEQGVVPAFGKRHVIELKVAASYSCRSRNNVKGARISEHGRGKAIDIAGFVMSDGTTWTVARDYNKTIRAAHKAACGIFGTTLGPGSDGYHEDHLHFDIARYSGGPYCR